MFMTLAAFVVSASATPAPIDCTAGTVVIGPGHTYSTTGDYQIVASTSTPISWDCIEVTGVNATAPNYTDFVNIDCNGKTIVEATSSLHALYAHANPSAVFMFNSQANVTACILSGSYPGSVLNNQLVYFEHVGTGPNGWSGMLGIEYHYGFEQVFYSPYHASTWTQIYFGGIGAYQSDHGTYQHILCDNHWDNVNIYGSCIGPNQSSHMNIDYVTVYGYPNPYSGSLPGQDDGVVVGADWITPACVSDIYVGHVTTYNVYDLTVETAGCVNDLHVQYATNNSTSGAARGIFGCFYFCSFTNLEFDHSTYSASSAGYATEIVEFLGPDSAGSTLTNVSIHDNSGSHSGSGNARSSSVGYAPALTGGLSQFSSISNVNISNNNFDGVQLVLQDNSTNYSGSGNSCASVYPSGAHVTC